MGPPGWRAAGAATWPGLAVLRGPVHTRRHRARYAPTDAVEVLRTDDHEVLYAGPLSAARQASRAFLSPWRARRAPKVAESLEEAGEELRTFDGFPRSQGTLLWTTNTSERVKGECRRRGKTHGTWATGQAAERLLVGLITSGQSQRRQIDGGRELAEHVVEDAERAA